MEIGRHGDPGLSVSLTQQGLPNTFARESVQFPDWEELQYVPLKVLAMRSRIVQLVREYSNEMRYLENIIVIQY